MLASTCLYA